MRHFEQETERSRRRAQTRDARGRASWVEFWLEIERSPAAVFEEDRADNTAWNLWQAMERSGRESRASGWNCRFIEEQFGREVADRLRATLQRIWRKQKPTLRSERTPDQRNTFLVKWQLGLAAIHAEAEDPNWAATLTDEEARLAARFAPIELNGFPSWLDALIASHPEAVDAVLGEELSLLLHETLDEGNASITLQNVRHASSSVAALFVPRIKAWIDQTRGGEAGQRRVSGGSIKPSRRRPYAI